MAGLGCSPEIIEGAFRIVWNLEAYCPCTGANETVEQLLESLRQGKIFCVNGSNLIMLNELALLSGLELSQSAKDILHFVPGEGRKPPSLEN